MCRLLFLFTFTVQLWQPSVAQKMMRLPDSAVLAEPLPVKSKTGIGFLRYEFGEYRLVNSRKGWWTKSETQTTEHGLLHRLLSNVEEVQEQTKEKRSFKQVYNNSDTVTVNLAITGVVFYNQPKNNLFGRNEGQATATHGISTIVATILLSDSAEWMLNIRQDFTAGFVDRKTEKAGILTNGIRSVELEPVEHYADGKKSMFLLGYLFRENGVVIAAVQVRGSSVGILKNNFVWLPKNETPVLQQVFAAAATVLLARAHETQAGGMGL